MGAAAYNRGTKQISAQIDMAARASEFVLIEDLNALPKHERAATPFGPVHFVLGHGGWWATCPTTGYGFWYSTLREAVRAWRVEIHACINGEFIARPLAR